MFFRTNKHVFNKDTLDYEKLRNYFGWVNADTVQKSIELSSQWGISLLNKFPMKRHLKSRNPALNIPRYHEPVAIDTIFSPAVDSGVNCRILGSQPLIPFLQCVNWLGLRFVL